ncbi:biotin/lipoyl-binding protein [Bacillaceae bacterium C204]|jgi:acetyl/propionyl-CoA carboxylase alpha subunit|uniref:biotin/lipoyl-binding protein n=1 Tax=Neobacillus sp. 204 TaxID=3383351 RepID=UPI00397E0870
MYYGVVLSPCYGKIKKISIKNDSRIYEWETLFMIISESGTLETVQTSMSGEVESLEVQEGDYVIPGMVLAYIKEDLFITGSD